MTHPPLPRVMVAPNGARRTKHDHPALPMSVDELIRDMQACQAAGADGFHVHVRDQEGKHVLDLDQVRDLLDRAERELPGFYTQITSESAGRYTPDQQCAFLAELPPCPVSIAVRECLSDNERRASQPIYHRAGLDIQHILYDADDAVLLTDAISNGIVPRTDLKTLIVHGRYGQDHTPGRGTLTETLAQIHHLLGKTDCAVCSFGSGETGILRHVLTQGGKVRVGFENNIYAQDGSIAASNAARVAEVLNPGTP